MIKTQKLYFPMRTRDLDHNPFCLCSSQERLKSLETSCNEHRRYDASAHDYEAWLEAAWCRLNELQSTSGTSDDVESRLSHIRVSLDCVSTASCRR